MDRTALRPCLAGIAVAAALPLLCQTIRIQVDLIQVDAVVTDDQGRHVSDLKAEDFRVFEDGKPQAITHFSFEGNEAAFPRANAGHAAVSGLPAAMERARVRRSIVLLVDDLGLAWNDLNRVRAMAKNFIENQMQPDDVASVVTASGGIGVFEQFTNDKRQLEAAVDRIHFSLGRNGLTWYTPLMQTQPGAAGQYASGIAHTGESFRNNALTRGSLSSLRFAISGLSDMPGRKAVAFFSDGFVGYVDDLVERANRASVVLYTFDARGLEVLNLTASDSVYADKTGLNIGSFEVERRRQFVGDQRGMALLAQGTGGIFFHDNNGLTQGLAHALDDMGSYYLLGYQPHREDFDRVGGRLQYHRIEVKVVRPGLHVRSRQGFMGVPDSRGAAAPFTAEGQLRQALFSPFQASDVPVQLSAFYSAGKRSPKQKHVAIPLRTMLAIDANHLTFTDAPADTKHLALEVVIAAYSADNGQVAASDKAFASDLSPKEALGLASSGLVHTFELALPGSGAYQIRAAVRDGNTGKTGSAFVFVQVPDFNGKHIALSSVLLEDQNPERNQALTRAGLIGAGGVVTRAFARGAELTWGTTLFGAVLNRSSGKPKLEITVNLYRGPEHIFIGKPIPLEIPDGEPRSVFATGKIRLPATLPSGDYALELSARDLLGKGAGAQASQWTDFTLHPL